MASKKRGPGRPKGSKNKKVTAVKPTGKRRGRPKKSVTAVAVPKSSLSAELGLLQKIDKKVGRIDRTVNAGSSFSKKS